MSIMIKGIDMPINCTRCPCSDDETRFCRAANKYIPMIGKPNFCPLAKAEERKKGRWIPCTERMPDIDEDGYTDKVLVSFDHYSGVEICEYRITDGVGRWYAGDTDDSPEDIDLQVTAWMPLPERYEGGEE